MQPIPSENEPRSTAPRLLLFPLRVGRAASLTPLVVGVVSAIIVVDLVGSFHKLTLAEFNIVGVLAGVLATALASTLSRRGVPDAVRLTDTAFELMHGRRVLRSVDLTNLKEVSVFDVDAGPILLVSDKRRHITLPSFSLVEARHYQELTQHIVEAMERIDPTGSVARGAVSTGRLRQEIAEQPVRGTYFITAVVTLASMLALRNREDLSGEPFPDEAVGALSTPLVMHGETFRLFSYMFHHASFMHLAVCSVGILYIGGYLEKILGWERVLLALVAGVLGGAIGHMLLAPPVAALGAGGGLYGLFGLLGAVALLKRHMPPTLVPAPGFWVMIALIAVLLPPTAELQVVGSLLPSSLSPQDLLAMVKRLSALVAVDLGGALLGFLVGCLMIVGVDVPASAHARQWMRPFAFLGIVVLGIGLVGGLLLLKRDRSNDVEILSQTLLDLPHTDASGELQNFVAYPRLVDPKASARSIEVAARLAQMAADNTRRRNPIILDTLAVARYRQKQVGEARSLVTEALKLMGEVRPRNEIIEQLEQVIRRHAEDMEKGQDLRKDDFSPR